MNANALLDQGGHQGKQLSSARQVCLSMENHILFLIRKTFSFDHERNLHFDSGGVTPSLFVRRGGGGGGGLNCGASANLSGVAWSLFVL